MKWFKQKSKGYVKKSASPGPCTLPDLCICTCLQCKTHPMGKWSKMAFKWAGLGFLCPSQLNPSNCWVVTGGSLASVCDWGDPWAPILSQPPPKKNCTLKCQQWMACPFQWNHWIRCHVVTPFSYSSCWHQMFSLHHSWQRQFVARCSEKGLGGSLEQTTLLLLILSVSSFTIENALIRVKFKTWILTSPILASMWSSVMLPFKKNPCSIEFSWAIVLGEWFLKLQ